jgi:shikimate 5-dehydrogenase
MGVEFMMNNDNSITVETLLYGYIAENAHSSRFSAVSNKLFKESGVNAMIIPMNIRPDDVAFTISQMRSSKLSGAVIANEYQEEAYTLLDGATDAAKVQGYCDLIRIEEGKLIGDLITPSALERYADAFDEDVALMAATRYFYDLITEEKRQ